ncbi:MAG: ribosomal RNA small subunit methyltransferase A [Deltaproteobacteria bacterium]|nr:ribosomal RNA small subunit methyltransferase A [Deltaproteobacteria bacterium]
MIQAKKCLGQHFLQDQTIARRIVQALDARPEDPVLEIGPGTGALTRHLLPRPGFYLGLEKDGHLARSMAENHPDAAFANIDALDFCWEKTSAIPGIKIIGNLPYNVASPLIWEMVSRVPDMSKGIFMVQKEVAERICSNPGPKTFGALSAWVQSFTIPALLFSVRPGSFLPRPKVDSAVIALTPKPDRFQGDTKALGQLLRRIFSLRRKQMGTILKSEPREHVAAWFEAQGISPSIRPECLSSGQFQSLLEALRF